MNPLVSVYPTAELVAQAAAARLILQLADLQAAGRVPAVALTGGGVGIATLAAVRASALADIVEWASVEFFFGDERFVPEADDDRNAKQARQALLDHIPVDPARVHAMPASDGQFGDDAAAAAAAYGAIVGDHGPMDVVLLGMGPDGHVASLFPGSPTLEAAELAVPVFDSPKPPPTRISLTLPVIQSAAEVWLLVAGSEKAPAVAAALDGAAVQDVPAAGAFGADRTRWMVDQAAASQLST